MLGKLGFVLLVLLFGALMFVAGLIMPESVRQRAAAAVADLVPGVASMLSETAAEAKAGTSSSPPSSAGDDNAENEAPVPYEALLVPAPPPPEGRYALQLGPYVAASAAETLAARAREGGYPVKTIDVVDRNGARWVAVAVGEYGSPEEARAARGSVSRRLELARPPTVIRLPPPPKKTDVSRTAP